MSSLMRDFSDWEVEEAHLEHEHGTTVEALAERLGTTKRTLARAFRKLEDLENRVGRIERKLSHKTREAE